MKTKTLVLSCISLLLLTTNVYASQCDVDFKAKRVVKVSNWFGTVEKPQFKSGTVSGVGATKKSCVKDSLSDLKKKKWKITYHKLRSFK